MIKIMKIKLLINKEQEDSLMQISLTYKNICQYVSDWIFENNFVLNYVNIQKEIYYELRNLYPLNAHLIISAIKTAAARYKATKKQLSQNPYRYKDNNGKWQKIRRTLEWLEKPIQFRKPQCDLIKDYDYRFLQDGSLSLTTLKGRIKVLFQTPPDWQEYLDNGWKLGTAKLISTNKAWYLCVPIKRPSPEIKNKNIRRIVGIDRGLNFIAVIADSEGNSYFISGRNILHKRHRYIETRRNLQEHNTRNSKRRLKSIGQRESRWMSDINHQISKTLIDLYGAETLFVIEDLTGVTFGEKNLRETKQFRYDKCTWAFYQLEQFLIYKAEAVGSKVLKVNPQYTSQRCPRCGIIDKEQRHHEDHEYRCQCGYRTNDDRVGALNLLELGYRYLAGDNNPKLVKTNKNIVAK